MSNRNLTAPFRDALTRAARRGETCAGTSSDDRTCDVLANELERVLLDRAYLDGYLEWIESELFARDYPRYVSSESERRSIGKDGLSRLASESLCRLALDPIAVLGLREWLVESMPAYWWNRLKELNEAANEPSRSPEHFWRQLASRLAMLSL